MAKSDVHINTQNDLFQIHIKIHISIESFSRTNQFQSVFLGLISFNQFQWRTYMIHIHNLIRFFSRRRYPGWTCSWCTSPWLTCWLRCWRCSRRSPGRWPRPCSWAGTCCAALSSSSRCSGLTSALSCSASPPWTDTEPSADPSNPNTQMWVRNK